MSRAGAQREGRGVATAFQHDPRGAGLGEPLSRRLFLQRGVAAAGIMIAGPPFLLSACGGDDLTEAEEIGYGPLREAGPELELPDGFRYVVISREGEAMSDGLLTPLIPDGMCAFPRPDGTVALVRNHEEFEPGEPIGPRLAYDPLGRGGVTTLIFDPESERLVDDRLTLNGTEKNCNGGPTPWLSWLSCEESTLGSDRGFRREHGYVFEVPVAARGPVEPVPLKAMGRFMHEACAVDPRSGIVYMTEDTQATDGFYRFVPEQPGRLRAGGRLEMLRVSGERTYDTRTGQVVGEPLPVEWAPISDVDPPNAEQNRHAVFEQGFDLGGAIFRSLEGAWWQTDRLFMAASYGGDQELGQIWQFRPLDDERGELKLIAESRSQDELDGPDNLTMASGGALLVCEDGQTSGDNYLRGVTTEGQVFSFARNLVLSDQPDEEHSEFAGATFSPDGRWLFVSIQHPGTTYAITGPWVRGPF